MTRRELFNLNSGDPLFSWSCGIVVTFEGWGVNEDGSSCLWLFGQKFGFHINETFKVSREYALSQYEVSAENALYRVNKHLLKCYKNCIVDLIKINK